VLTFWKSPRERVLAAAESQLGEHRWELFLNGVTNQTPGPQTSWCGIFALWALHQAGLANDTVWKFDGPPWGFLYKLPATRDPKPGDIAYQDQPFQHHAIVKKVEGGTVHTIDGNSTGNAVREKTRPKSAFTAFYSIQPFIDGTA